MAGSHGARPVVPNLSGPGDRCSSEGWCRCWRRLQVQVELRSPAGAHLPRCGRVLTGRDQDRPTARGLGPDSGHSGPATGGHGWRGDTGKRQVQGSQGAGGAPGVSTPTTCRSRRAGRGAVGPGGGGGSAWAGAGRTGRPLRLALTSGKGRCVTPGPECQVTAQQQRRLPRLCIFQGRVKGTQVSAWDSH